MMAMTAGIEDDNDTGEPPARRVLVVDDDPIMRELMGQQFAEMGFGVFLTENGEEACGVLDREDLDLAVIDLNMPRLDGFGLLERIRGNPRQAGLPVIVATASGDRPSIERAYRLGASSFVTKPINWAQFAHHAQFVIRNGQIERDLRLAQAEAAAAARMKNGLFSVLGHELKTPLTALIGLTDVLGKSLGARLQSLDAEHLGLVSDAAQRLNHIVGDILILSKALAGPGRLGMAWNPVHELLEDSLLGFKTRAALLGIDLKLIAPPPALLMRCDAALLRQALRRLIDNAIKFSQPGSTVTVWAEDHGDGALSLAVSDQGPGISVTRLRECLQPFVQADMSYSRPAEGLGLGLPIANAIAEAHGGELSVSTTPGSGLTATLRLPPSADLQRVRA
jgi:signal transduction histidine kinase